MDRPHVLVIEDDQSVCELLYSCLNKAEYRVSVTHTGETGLQQIEEDTPQLVILDLNLPGMNGLDVCRAMRRDPWLGRIPVLMLTGQAEEDDIVVGLEVGADDYMIKPFSPKLLLTRVMALLRRGSARGAVTGPAEAAGSDTKRFLLIKTLGRCELQFDGRRLLWSEDFSPAQRQLMAMLVGSANGRVSQEEVQAELWPDSSTTRARSSFDSLLSRVRRTLDEALTPFDSKKHLVLKRGFLGLENCRIDAHEFRRLARKAAQQVASNELWPAEITYSSAFSLWQGRFLPGNFGSDLAVGFQDELEQLFLVASQTFARLLADTGRFQQAARLLRDALRYDPANDEIVRLLYQLCMVQDNPGQASQILKQYGEALAREKFSVGEIEEILEDLPERPPRQGWLNENCMQ